MTTSFDPFDETEWADAPGCDAFEMAIEMRARSALAPSAVSILEAHLGACESCRAHAARAGDVDAALAGDSRGPDWEDLERNLRRARRQFHILPWILLGAVLVPSAVFQLVRYFVFGLPPESLGIGLTLVLAAAAILGPYLFHWRRLNEPIEKVDSIADLRAQLERSTRVHWYWPLAFVAMLVILGGDLIVYYDAAVQGVAKARYSIFKSCVRTVLFGVLLLLNLRWARRAKRELAELH